MIKYICIIVEEAAALGILVLSIISCSHNHLGQVIINLTAGLILCLRLQNIVAFYRLYLNSSWLESYATFLISLLFSLGKLIENHNPTLSHNYRYFNVFCTNFVILILFLNILYYFLGVIAVLAHSLRQLYKLAAGTLLSSSASLLEEQLRMIRKSFKPYSEFMEEESLGNSECSICLSTFEPEQQCIKLPGCNHIFHSECIDEWLTSKSNCPYCRSNIRLQLFRA